MIGSEGLASASENRASELIRARPCYRLRLTHVHEPQSTADSRCLALLLMKLNQALNCFRARQCWPPGACWRTAIRCFFTWRQGAKRTRPAAASSSRTCDGAACPHAFGERAVLKLMYAALIRAAER
jgi:hypothetical protein